VERDAEMGEASGRDGGAPTAAAGGSSRVEGAEGHIGSDRGAGRATRIGEDGGDVPMGQGEAEGEGDGDAQIAGTSKFDRGDAGGVSRSGAHRRRGGL